MTNTEPVSTPRTAELMARQFDEARKLKDGLPREEIAAAWIDLAMELESALQAERDKLSAELAALEVKTWNAAIEAVAEGFELDDGHYYDQVRESILRLKK